MGGARLRREIQGDSIELRGNGLELKYECQTWREQVETERFSEAYL